jgi:hypothetical protein
MRIRALLLTPLLAAAALGVGASGASAATLFTQTAHSSRVPLGTTGIAHSVGGATFTSGTAVINTCTSAALHFDVKTNNHTHVVLTVTSQTFTGCTVPVTVTPHSEITVNGTGAAFGPETAWNATVIGFRFDMLGGLYTGNLTTGVTVSQPTAGTSPLSMHNRAAGTFTGPLTGNGRLAVTYRLTGHAAGWSLTNH